MRVNDVFESFILSNKQKKTGKLLNENTDVVEWAGNELKATLMRKLSHTKKRKWEDIITEKYCTSEIYHDERSGGIPYNSSL